MVVRDERESAGAGIQVIARAAAVLRALKGKPDGLTLSQLAQEVDLPRSTVQRIVGALLAEDLLTPVSQSSGVRLGPEIIALAGEVQPAIVDLARPYLMELRDATGETVDLVEFRRNHLLFIDQHLGGHRLCAVSGVGRTFPLHNSANGKSCLALLAPGEARKAALDTFGAGESALLERLMNELKEVRATGIGYDWEENAPGISAVGTAFRSRTGQIYAIAVPTPADRFAVMHAEIGRQLLATRAKLVAALGLDDRGVEGREGSSASPERRGSRTRDAAPGRLAGVRYVPGSFEEELVARRAGSADLPLHGGRVPAWLGRRMARLGAVITEAIVHHYGREEFLRRLAHPFWFQSFGAVMGMDWHSSGITTSVIGALKHGLAHQSAELGLHVCGGRGRHSRQTPHELLAIGARVGFDGAGLAEASRLVAKVDSAAVQDGFDLYLHGFIVADDGQWVVVQQGMNGDTRTARRYHWTSAGLTSFVEAPHAAIDGRNQGRIVNLTDRRAAAARRCQVALLGELGPDRLVRQVAELEGRPDPVTPDEAPFLPHLVMPAHHDVRPKDVMLRRLHGALAAAAERGPRDFADLLLVPGVGARTVQALAMVAEVVHGAPARFADPARFSLAHGGKDRQPFPVPTAVYDATIAVMKSAIGKAKLGQEERLEAIRRLDAQTRRLEQEATGPSWPAYIADERRNASAYGGRSVFGWEPAPASVPTDRRA